MLRCRICYIWKNTFPRAVAHRARVCVCVCVCACVLSVSPLSGIRVRVAPRRSQTQAVHCVCMSSAHFEGTGVEPLARPTSVPLRCARRAAYPDNPPRNPAPRIPRCPGALCKAPMPGFSSGSTCFQALGSRVTVDWSFEIEVEWTKGWVCDTVST